MSEAILQPTHTSDAADGLRADALRAQDWAGEPFLHPGEDAAEVLAPGTARRAALDEALAEIEAGRSTPSSRWKVRFGFLLGLERVLSSKPPTTAAGTELRKHQIDALAGMLTELIAANQRQRRGRGERQRARRRRARSRGRRGRGRGRRGRRTTTRPEGFVGEDPGAVRRYRFRHPTASGKTIAAAGFVEAARSLGILILTHRRLLVSQFQRDLTTEGYGDRFTDFIEAGKEPLRGDPITIQTYAWFARHAGSLSREAYQLVICDEAHTALGEKTSAAIRSFPEPIYIGMTATEQLIAKQVSDVFPASVDDLPLADAARRGLIAPLRCLRVPPAAAINSVPIVGGDFEERALAAALDHQALNQAAASLYRERFDTTPGNRLRGRRRPRVQPRPGVPRRRAEGGGRLGPHAARQAGRDARLVRARRDQRPDQRDAARRGLELAARDRLHAPRADRVEARLPAADRPDHADAPAQGGGHRRRLHAEVGHAQRPRRLAPLPARGRLLPRGSARHAGAAPPRPAPRPPQALAGDLARPGHRGRLAPARRDPARVAADRPQVPGRGRAALLGDDRRAAAPLRPAGGVREEVRREPRVEARARDVPLRLRRREPEPAAADDRAPGSRLDDDRARRLRRPRHARQPGAAVGEGPRRRDQDPAPRDRRGEGERARPDPPALDVEAREGDAEDPGPARERRVPGGEAAARRGRELARAPARGEREQARAGGEGSAARRRRGAARVVRGVHAARQQRARPRPRGARRDDGDRERPGRQPARPEGAVAQVPPAQAEEEARRGPGAGQRSRRARPPRTAPAPAEGGEAKPKRRRRRRKPAAAAADGSPAARPRPNRRPPSSEGLSDADPDRDRVRRRDRHRALAVRAARAADRPRRRRDGPPAAGDRRRHRRQLHRLHALRRLAARPARPAAGRAPQPRDRAAAADGALAARPQGRRAARAPAAEC